MRCKHGSGYWRQTQHTPQTKSVRITVSDFADKHDRFLWLHPENLAFGRALDSNFSSESREYGSEQGHWTCKKFTGHVNQSSYHKTHAIPCTWTIIMNVSHGGAVGQEDSKDSWTAMVCAQAWGQFCRSVVYINAASHPEYGRCANYLLKPFEHYRGHLVYILHSKFPSWTEPHSSPHKLYSAKPSLNHCTSPRLCTASQHPKEWSKLHVQGLYIQGSKERRNEIKNINPTKGFSLGSWTYAYYGSPPQLSKGTFSWQFCSVYFEGLIYVQFWCC